jgi:hypothetical protein
MLIFFHATPSGDLINYARSEFISDVYLVEVLLDVEGGDEGVAAAAPLVLVRLVDGVERGSPAALQEVGEALGVVDVLLGGQVVEVVGEPGQGLVVAAEVGAL